MPTQNFEKPIKNFLSSRGLTKSDPHYYRNQFSKLMLTRRTTECLLITLLQYVGLTLGHLNGTNVPIWPATGVALAMLFLRGNRALIGIFLGCLLAHWQAELSTKITIIASIIHVLELFLIRKLSLTLIGPIKPLHQIKILWQFALTLTVISGISTYILWAILLSGPNGLGGWWTAWREAWFGDVIGILTFTPLCLIWDTYVPKRFPFQTIFKTHFKKVITLFGGIIVFNASCFVVQDPIFILSLFGLSFIFLLFISMQFGQFGVTLGAVISATIFLSGANANLPLFIEPLSHFPFWIIQAKLGAEALLPLTLATYSLRI